MKKIMMTGFAGVLALSATFAAADSHAGKAITDAVNARHAVMQLYAYNLGQLGGMAKGAMPYDAEAAGKAAANLAMLSKLDNSTMWPMGSEAGAVDGSRAKAEMWQNFPDVIEKATALVTAADAMAAAAGTDLEALRGAIGGVGGACGACHKAYRAPAQ